MVTDPDAHIRHPLGHTVIVAPVSMRYTLRFEKNPQAVLPMRLKTVLPSLALIVTVAMVAGYIYLQQRDYSHIKRLIEQAMTDAAGRRLVIHGDLALALSLKPSLEVKDVTLANASWGTKPDMVTIGLLRVRLRILPLFRGEVLIKNVELINTQVLLETGASGQANWHFTPANATRADSGIKELGIKRLGIEQLAVTFFDGEAGAEQEHYTLERLELRTTPDRNALALELQGSANGKPLSLTGKTGLLRSLFSASEFPLDLTGNIAGAAVSLKGSIASGLTLAGISLDVTASGTNLSAVGPALRMAFPHTDSFELKAHLSGDADAIAATQIQAAVSRQDVALALSGSIDNLLDVEKINLQVKGSGSDLSRLGSIIQQPLPRTGPFQFSGRLTGSATALSVAQIQGNVSHSKLKLSLTGKVRDLQTLRGIDLKWNGSGRNLTELNTLTGLTLPESGPFKASGRLSGSPHKLVISSLNASVQLGLARFGITGRVNDLLQLQGIELGFEGTGKAFAELGQLFNTQLPELGPFSFDGQLNGSSKQLDIRHFSAKIENSDFNGWSTVQFGNKPRITVKLESGLIDITRIIDQLKDENPETNRKTPAARQTPFSHEPLPFALLGALDADISLRARNIKARDATLEFGQLAVRIDDGQLRMDTLEATYRNSRISASLNIRSGPPAIVSTRFLVQGFEFGRFLRETNISDKVEVKADFAADLRSLGQTPHRLAANLDGIFAAVFGKGKMPRFLDLLAEDLSRRVISIWGSSSKSGNLNCGIVQFAIQQGVASSNAFLFDTQVGYLKGKGNINLASEQISFLLSPHPRDASLFSLKTKLRISGSVSDPSVRPDAKSLMLKGSKALSALVLGPAGLLAPFVTLGARNPHPCDTQQLRSRLEDIYR